MEIALVQKYSMTVVRDGERIYLCYHCWHTKIPLTDIYGNYLVKYFVWNIDKMGTYSLQSAISALQNHSDNILWHHLV